MLLPPVRRRHVVPYTLILVGAWQTLLRYRRRRFGGLDNAASFSSRVIAACRAEESRRPDAFLVDSLAEVLAGPQAMAWIKRGQPHTIQTSSAGDAQPHLWPTPEVAPAKQCSDVPPVPRPIPRIIMRTLFFDHVILEAVGVTTNGFFEQLRAYCVGACCGQVVLLGAGMDTRPWRLDLPPGVRWFEVDRADVLRAKQQTMSAAGAAFKAFPEQQVTPRTAPPVTTGLPATPALHVPLRSATWHKVACDLQKRGWSSRLRQAGLDPQIPTVFVLEGLLYYMDAKSVPRMLEEAASISAPGSILAASVVSEEMVARIRQRKLARDSIMHSWKWGCPRDAAQYFGDCGWDVLSCTPWRDAAIAYGYTPQEPEGNRNRQAGSSSGAAYTGGGAVHQRDDLALSQHQTPRSCDGTPAGSKAVSDSGATSSAPDGANGYLVAVLHGTRHAPLYPQRAQQSRWPLGTDAP